MDKFNDEEFQRKYLKIKKNYNKYKRKLQQH